MHGTSPLVPMGAITGKPDRNRMREVLSSYKSVGIDQFLIYPRTGLEIEYMSDEWMEFVKYTVEIAADLHMHIWLYDEYNFPSGNCRGQVTQGHEEFYPNALVFEKTTEGYSSRVVRNRIGSDILNPDVVARFISLTHERYFETLKPYFGSVITAIYTDEPSFAYYTRLGTFCEEVDKESFRLSWYEGLESEYRAVCGSDFRDDVIRHLNGDTPSCLWENYYRIMGNRMRRVYIGQIAKWCEAHGIYLTGHLMEERADTTVRYNGNPLRMLSAFTLPGMDETASRHTLNAHNMELSALSVVQYAGRKRDGQLAELFSVSPTDMPLGEMRTIIWTTACFGVDHYVIGVASLDPKGNWGKPCYYYPVSQTNPNFVYYPELLKTAKEASAAARRPYKPEVRLRFPSTLLMRVANTPDEAENGKRMVALLESLVRHQVQYLYIDEEEKSDVPVISVTQNGCFLEGTEHYFKDTEAFAAYLCSVVPRKLVVSENGIETRDILVRLWDDGHFTLVDLSGADAPDRLLTVRLGENESKVRLSGNGVFDGYLPGIGDRMPVSLGRAETKDLRISLARENLIRLSYTMKQPQIVLEVKKDLPDVRLITRNDPDPVLLALDSQHIACAYEDTRLPDGFSPLYRMSAPFTLNKGIHRITTLPCDLNYRYITSSTISGVYEPVKNAPTAVDCRFLPSAFLCGTFSCERNEDGTITLDVRMPQASFGPIAGASDYTGTLTYEMSVSIPAGKGRILRLNTDCACTEVSLDGRNLGLRCWAPWEWSVPDEISSGRHKLSVGLTTSICPMFGDLSVYKGEQPYWVSVAMTQGRKVSILEAPEWLTTIQEET